MDQKDLVDKLLKASSVINEQSRKGSGNYVMFNSSTTILLGKRRIRISKIKKLILNINELE